MRRNGFSFFSGQILLKQIYLKSLRVWVSLLVLTCTSFVFLDLLGKLPSIFVDCILYFQGIPSLLRFIHSAGWASAGFIFVLLITVLFGRTYCSFMCPLGTLQDILIRIRKPLGMHKKRLVFSYQRPQNILRYGVLFLTVASCLTGSLLLLSLFDPFSQFGRIVSDMIRPLVVGVNNVLADIVEWDGFYFLYPLEYKAPHPSTLILPVAVFALLLYLTANKGRFFCNSLCPLGALLGLLSYRSLLTIAIDRDVCTSCGRCVMLCKAGCIDLREKQVDFSRCVSCFNCIRSCPEAAIQFRPSVLSEKKKVPRFQQERRIILTSLLFLFSFGSKNVYATPTKPRKPQVKNERPTTVINEKHFPVIPPGGKSLSHFFSSCTACHLCVSICPTGVLQPSLVEYGIDGILKPRLNTLKGFCNFECTRCGEVCPTGAIQPLSVAEKKQTQMGKTQFIKKNCVVETDKKDCGACAEHCPTKAVRMVPFEGKLKIPELDNKYCIGCGACEHICPVLPHKAIFVDGLATQGTAEPPKSKPITIVPMEDFPF